MMYKNLGLLTLSLLTSSATAFALSIQDTNATKIIVSIDDNKTMQGIAKTNNSIKTADKDLNTTPSNKSSMKEDINKTDNVFPFKAKEQNVSNNIEIKTNDKNVSISKNTKEKKYNISNDLNLLAKVVIAINTKTNKAINKIESVEKKYKALKSDLEAYNLNHKDKSYLITSQDIQLLDKVIKRYKKLSYKNRKKMYYNNQDLVFFDYPVNKSWAVHSEVTILKKGSRFRLDKCYKNWVHVKYRGWIKNNGIAPKIKCK